MEMMFIKEADNLNRDENVILAVIDSHVLVYLAIKWKLPSRFTVAEEILISISRFARY